MDEVPVARLCVAGGNQYPSQTTLGNFYIASCKKITMTDTRGYRNCWPRLTARQPGYFYGKTCPVNSDRRCIIAVGTNKRPATERHVVLPL